MLPTLVNPGGDDVLTDPGADGGGAPLSPCCAVEEEEEEDGAAGRVWGINEAFCSLVNGVSPLISFVPGVWIALP